MCIGGDNQENGIREQGYEYGRDWVLHTASDEDLERLYISQDRLSPADMRSVVTLLIDPPDRSLEGLQAEWSLMLAGGHPEAETPAFIRGFVEGALETAVAIVRDHGRAVGTAWRRELARRQDLRLTPNIESALRRYVRRIHGHSLMRLFLEGVLEINLYRDTPDEDGRHVAVPPAAEPTDPSIVDEHGRFYRSITPLDGSEDSITDAAPQQNESTENSGSQSSPVEEPDP